VLSTLSSKASEEGFPTGSVVEYVADDQGRPIFSFSTLSPHTGDVQKDGRCSLTVLAEGFKASWAGRSFHRRVCLAVQQQQQKQQQTGAKLRVLPWANGEVHLSFAANDAMYKSP
jgi:putative heme iron utilization protein